MGSNMPQNEDIHAAGFLSSVLTLNLNGFTLALDMAGARRKIKANKAMKAAVLVILLCIGASFRKLGTPCRMMGKEMMVRV